MHDTKHVTAIDDKSNGSIPHRNGTIGVGYIVGGARLIDPSDEKKRSGPCWGLAVRRQRSRALLLQFLLADRCGDDAA